MASQLGELDREVDDSRVFSFPQHFQRVASDYITVPDSLPTSGTPQAFSSSHWLLLLTWSNVYEDQNLLKKETRSKKKPLL